MKLLKAECCSLWWLSIQQPDPIGIWQGYIIIYSFGSELISTQVYTASVLSFMMAVW